MKCPIDDETLVIAERGGVEIDYCPKCRGVWLDRGELDKIIERAAQATAPMDSERDRRPLQDRDRRDDRRDLSRHSSADDDRGYGRKPKRRESFLGDLFDF
ncbi:hypothetical protein EQ718_20815 (plasmid) [Paracoccus versutus]|uniref:Transcription factor zinc-finger domain-containing protein n=1 Tax=Paracoccus versutus TaxID=34007 RepID=A0AAQ0HDJ9_PARVE|nr:zf-TFIIB domain-containing protein [Paracoccus versutus]REG31618.1 hypothetical protein ATH84_10476 [Paracoccus versutus]WEJ81313.1 hypothetical protein EQ718_20815 [Paracoccus versutus]